MCPSCLQAAPFFDRLVFSKIAARLGGCVKAVVSGGAPLAPHVEDFLRVTMCAPVVQGYGLTETSAASFIACSDNMVRRQNPRFFSVFHDVHACNVCSEAERLRFTHSTRPCRDSGAHGVCRMRLEHVAGCDKILAAPQIVDAVHVAVVPCSTALYRKHACSALLAPALQGMSSTRSLFSYTCSLSCVLLLAACTEPGKHRGPSHTAH